MARTIQQKNLVRFDENGCWTWLGPVNSWGRPFASGGHFPNDQTKFAGRQYLVQHVAFEKAFGYNPKRIGMTCGNNLCINAAHMFDKTKKRLEQFQMSLLVPIQQRISELELVLGNMQVLDDPEAAEYAKAIQAELVILRNKEKDLVKAEEP